MILDKNIYSKTVGSLLAHEICNSKTLMVNESSGHDIIYQKNKVDNLKILSKTMNKVLIKPGETFSFYNLAKNSKRYGTYKEGLVLINNKIVPRKGGGICHLSNLLYYTFLKTPLTIVERHGHKVKSFPNPDKDSLEGVDATINMGWLDLRVRNDTKNTYQIVIDFDDEYMYAKILSDKKITTEKVIINDDFKYIKKGEIIFESVAVIGITRDKKTKKEIKREKLYDEVVKVDYDLPKNAKIKKIK